MSEENLEKWNTFETLEVYAYKRVRYYVQNKPYNTETYNKSEQQILRLLGMLCKLKKHNRSLAKMAYLNCCAFFRIPSKDIFDYHGKRGRVPKGVVGVQFIMEMLKCSRRTAFDYQLFQKIAQQTDTVERSMMMAVSEPKTVKHIDTIKV